VNTNNPDNALLYIIDITTMSFVRGKYHRQTGCFEFV